MGTSEMSLLPDDPISDREALGFADEVMRVFSEYLRGFGFSPSHRETTLVDFSSGKVIVRLYHGRSSYEVNLEAGPQSLLNREPLYGIHEIVASGAGEKESVRLTHADKFRVFNREDIRAALSGLLELAKQFLAPGLQGDPGWWQKIEKTRLSMAERYAKESRIRSLKAQARIAREKGDFQRVVKVLESIEGHRSDQEDEWLEEARQRLKSHP